MCVRSHRKLQNSARIVVTIGHFQSFAMVKEWDVPQRTFLVVKKLGGRTWHRSRLNMLTGILQLLSLSLVWLFIRWPAPTWGITNAPPPASKRSLNRLAKKFLNCLSQDWIYHPMPSTLAELLCWRCGGRSLQQQAGHGRRMSAQNEGKGSG